MSVKMGRMYCKIDQVNYEYTWYKYTSHLSVARKGYPEEDEYIQVKRHLKYTHTGVFASSFAPQGRLTRSAETALKFRKKLWADLVAAVTFDFPT